MKTWSMLEFILHDSQNFHDILKIYWALNDFSLFTSDRYIYKSFPPPLSAIFCNILHSSHLPAFNCMALKATEKKNLSTLYLPVCRNTD